MGRDQYIGIDNGGLSCVNGVSLAPKHGAFGEKKKSDFLDHSLAHIPSKNPNYQSNGGGRDTYIVRSNGGFYPAHTIAEYQKTF
jgi:hypothetical protein